MYLSASFANLERKSFSASFQKKTLVESIVEGEPGYDPYVIPIFRLFEPCVSYKRNFYEKIGVCSLESVHKLWRKLTR